MFEFLFELLFKILLSYPGAFVRWTLQGFKKPFSHYNTGDDGELNSFIGMVVLTTIVCMIIIN